ncbi:uncharacterized protein DS421_17g600950 [Arachis hypogaea]|nr:uncharacterized protein DS421_17g600950 [Arachis hypogaea]
MHMIPTYPTGHELTCRLHYQNPTHPIANLGYKSRKSTIPPSPVKLCHTDPGISALPPYKTERTMEQAESTTILVLVYLSSVRKRDLPPSLPRSCQKVNREWFRVAIDMSREIVDLRSQVVGVDDTFFSWKITDFGALNFDSPSLGTEIGKLSPSHATGEPDLGEKLNKVNQSWNCVRLILLIATLQRWNNKEEMDKESSSVVRSSNNVNGGGGEGSLVLRASSDGTRHTTTPDLVLQWGNRKRLRCMKVQVKDKDKDDSSAPVQRTTVRVDRRVVRTDKDSLNKPPLGLNNNNITLANNNHNHHQTNGYPNLRQRPSSPQQRILRNSETSSAMRGVVGGQSNGGVRGIASPDRGAHDKRGTHNNNNHHHHHHHNDNNKSAASSDTAHDSKKGGSPSGSGDAVPQVWPPKFVIALTNKEKEEDFFAIKGTKLPQRPKKRAKFIQRTLNLVSPGAWLSDLTLERYEVREKKISKKRPRGLKAMNNVESDSE